jgi:hypothetical protein
MFVIDSTVALRVLREDDAAELFALTDSNRAYCAAGCRGSIS